MSESTKPWYKRAFDRSYLERYKHRDENEAAAQVAFIIEHAERFCSHPLRTVLDIACGAGRHVTQFAQRGFVVSGIDLSPDLLDAARSRLRDDNLAADLHLGDMRTLPFPDASFDLLICMFTSFGYFEDDALNAEALRSWRRVSKDGTLLFIDFLNRERIINSLIPHSERTLGGKTIVENRSITLDGKRVEKHITELEVHDKREFFESVRLFSLEELENLLSQADFCIVATFGDFQGSPFSATSERLLIFAAAS